MSIAIEYLKSTYTNTPIGFIPRDYSRFTELLRAASLRYTDITKKDVAYRDWKVVGDEKPATNRFGVVTGQGSSKFRKFSMLLDLIRHQEPEFSAEQVYDAALSFSVPGTKKMMEMTWQNMNNEMARLGVNGYEILQSKKKNSSEIEF